MAFHSRGYNSSAVDDRVGKWPILILIWELIPTTIKTSTCVATLLISSLHKQIDLIKKFYFASDENPG